MTMIPQILMLLSGLTMFLVGVMKLSVDIHRIFDAKIRYYIKYSVKKPIYGVILGIISTFFFQSSSATTVLTVGLVSAGLISFFNSLGVILGADIGTTFTAQLVAWKITAISPIFIIFGGLLWILAKDKLKIFGEILFHFGMIFFGLFILSGVVEPLKNSPFLISILESAKNPFLGVFVGIVLVSLVHSSAIPISILIILSQQGLVTIDSALPIVLGANIGTTFTAILAAIGSNINGKRSALSHFFFKLIGTIAVFPFIAFYGSFLKTLTDDVGQQIVFGHFLFNLFLFFLFFWWLKPFSTLVKKIIPGEEQILSLWPEFLDERDLANSALALSYVRKELKREILLAQKMFNDGLGLILNFKKAKIRDIEYIEIVVDNLQSEIADYLWKISKNRLSLEDSKKLFSYTVMVDDIERIADQVLNIVHLARRKSEKKAEFSEEAEKELAEIKDILLLNLEDAISLIDEKDEKSNKERAMNIFEREKRVDVLVMRFRELHLERFKQGICPAEAGPIFIDILINLERISDHCENIAESFDSPASVLQN